MTANSLLKRSRTGQAALVGLLCLTVSPALAWEAKFGAVCTLTHKEEAAQVEVTYDPSIPEYAIAVTLNSTWEESVVFSLRFDGPQELTISTGRHRLSDDGATLIVRDRGFGNVLNGLEFNNIATALLGERDIVSVSLEGAAPEVQKFRACATGVST